MEGQISTPAAPAAAPSAPSTTAPTAPSAGGMSAEPAPAPSPEPAPAPAPAPEPAPSFPSADEWGWDEWDGTPDALPEEVRGWHSKFDERFNSRLSEYEKQVADAQKAATAWERMYNSVWDGAEDPRIAETTQALERVTAEFEAYKAQQAELTKRYEEYVDRESDRYFRLITDKHPDIMERLNNTPGADDMVFALMEGDAGLDFEDALLVWDRGEKAVAFARQAITDGVKPEYVKALVEHQFPKQAPPAPKPQPKSVDLVNGGDNAPRRAVVPSPQSKPMSLSEQRMAAAERALANMRKR